MRKMGCQLHGLAVGILLTVFLYQCQGRSEQGCRICSLPRCGPYNLDCPWGEIRDRCGCEDSCQCAGCPPISLSVTCQYGRRKDGNGCPTDQCLPNPCRCPRLQCSRDYTCPNGHIKHNCECSINCQCAGCPWVDESNRCPNGRKTDSNGCPTNECKTVSTVGPPCSPCSVVGCAFPPGASFSCPNGYERDRCGCTASCQCAGCPRVNETISCSNGRMMDVNGCPTDRCMGDVTVTNGGSKPGVCPSWGRPRNLPCRSDRDCVGFSKCCPYNGRFFCRPSIIPEPRPSRPTSSSRGR